MYTCTLQPNFGCSEKVSAVARISLHPHAKKARLVARILVDMRSEKPATVADHPHSLMFQRLSQSVIFAP